MPRASMRAASLTVPTDPSTVDPGTMSHHHSHAHGGGGGGFPASPQSPYADDDDAVGYDFDDPHGASSSSSRGAC